MFPNKNSLKQGNAFSPLLFNFALYFATRRVQVNQNGLQLKRTHQLLVYSDDINILGGSVHTIKKNTEAFAVARKKICTSMPRELSTWSFLEIRMHDKITTQI
jgi:hypothetical protein